MTGGYSKIAGTLVKINMYCTSCRATSTFVRIEHTGEWMCVGDASRRREGCGKRLQPVDRVR